MNHALGCAARCQSLDHLRLMVCLEYLHKHISEGGLNLLDIQAHNEAIEPVWLVEYLNLTPSI